jgi:hypothetical protein
MRGQNHALQSGLRDEHTIEGIQVVARKCAGGQCVRHSNRKHLGNGLLYNSESGCLCKRCLHSHRNLFFLKLAEPSQQASKDLFKGVLLQRTKPVECAHSRKRSDALNQEGTGLEERTRTAISNGEPRRLVV